MLHRIVQSCAHSWEPNKTEKQDCNSKTLTPFCQDLVPELHFFGDDRELHACMWAANLSLLLFACFLQNRGIVRFRVLNIGSLSPIPLLLPLTTEEICLLLVVWCKDFSSKKKWEYLPVAVVRKNVGGILCLHCHCVLLLSASTAARWKEERTSDNTTTVSPEGLSNPYLLW